MKKCSLLLLLVAFLMPSFVSAQGEGVTEVQNVKISGTNIPFCFRIKQIIFERSERAFSDYDEWSRNMTNQNKWGEWKELNKNINGILNSKDYKNASEEEKLLANRMIEESKSRFGYHYDQPYYDYKVYLSLKPNDNSTQNDIWADLLLIRH